MEPLIFGKDLLPQEAALCSCSKISKKVPKIREITFLKKKSVGTTPHCLAKRLKLTCFEKNFERSRSKEASGVMEFFFKKTLVYLAF